MAESAGGGGRPGIAEGVVFGGEHVEYGGGCVCCPNVFVAFAAGVVEFAAQGVICSRSWASLAGTLSCALALA